MIGRFSRYCGIIHLTQFDQRPGRGRPAFAAAVGILLAGFCIAHASEAVALDAGQRQRVFLRAQELFDSAKSPDDYRRSALEMETLLADGFQNGAVCYNLGNAWFRAGEYGRAILNYRRAKFWRPRDSYLEANLQQALMLAPGRLPEQPAPWWTHVFFWTDWLSYPAKVRLTGFCLVGAAGLAVLAVVLKTRRLHPAALVTVAISVGLGTDAGLSSPGVADRQRAVIVRETVARKGTGKDYEPAFDQPLRDGAEFTILSETPDWILGHFAGIGDGWVRREVAAR